MKLTNIKSGQGWNALILFMGMFFCMGVQAATEPSSPVESTAIFARVGEEIVTKNEYLVAYQAGVRDKFYHGKPNNAELAKFRSDIENKLIEGALLVQEAKKRKLKPDNDAVEQKLAMLDAKNRANPKWQSVRDGILVQAREKYEKESLRSKLEMQVRDVPEANDKQLQDYYDRHPKEFTAPDQMRVSLIMLRVDPGSTKETWKTAGQFATGLLDELKKGADFAEMAKKYSDDRGSAEQGGDMGYLHGGMLGGLAEHAVSKLKPGELTDVVTFMEGVGIMKLTEHHVGKVNKFEDVKARVAKLWAEEEGERRYKALIKQLRASAEIHINKSLFSEKK